MKTSISKLRVLFPIFLLSSMSGSVQSPAGILDAWHWRNPTPFADTMESVAFGAGRFVAVGDAGLIHVSSDGISWDSGQQPVSLTLNQVIYVNDQFIAVGDSGAVVTSPDGLTWTPQSSGATNDLLAITFGNGRYVACGAAGQLVISTDGIHWTTGSDGAIALDWITFGNGVFITSASGMNVSVSPDGQNWATEPLPSIGGDWPHTVHQAAYGNGMLIAVATDETGGLESFPAAYFYESADGTNWTQESMINFGPDLAYTHCFLAFLNGMFQEMTESGATCPISRTTDGNSYTTVYAPTNGSNGHSMTYGNGQYLVMEDTGATWYSADETNWTTAYGGFRTAITDIIQGNSNLVVVSDSIWVSSDGVNFTSNNTPAGLLDAVAFDGTNYVAVGGSGSVRFGSGAVYTSTNSTDWVQQTSNAGQQLFAVCKGSSQWVAVGNAGTVISSGNTLAWTLRSSGTANNLYGVAFGNGLFVAVGAGGTVITSADGATWDVQYSGTVSTLNGVAYLNGQFFAIGASGTILTSADGMNWSSENSGTTATLSSIAFGYGGFLACGPNTPACFLASSNGVDWQNISGQVPTGNYGNTVAYLNNSFWIAGGTGLLLQSDTADGVPHLSGSLAPGHGGIQLKINILPPATYKIQFRSNLLSDTWHDIMTFTNSVSSDTWTDTNAFNLPLGFYRAVSP